MSQKRLLCWLDLISLLQNEASGKSERSRSYVNPKMAAIIELMQHSEAYKR